MGRDFICSFFTIAHTDGSVYLAKILGFRSLNFLLKNFRIR